MTIGNWKEHILIKCAKCVKPMGFHIETESAICNDCDKVEQVRVYMDETRHRLKKESPREKIERLYLSYFNDFLTIAYFAEYYGLSERKANDVIIAGRKLNHRRHR